MDDYSKSLGKKRLRFRDWLIDKLNTRDIEGVQWIDRERGLFRIPWVHGSHRTWNINDAEIFRQWAIYSGKYEPTRDMPDYRKWKTNFRCTLNGLRDFKEVRNESSSREPRRFKIYSLESIDKGKKEQSRREKEEKQAGPSDLTDKEIVQMVDEMTAPEPITRPALQKPLLVTQARPNAAYPAFETLVMGKSTGMSTFPYTPWFLAAWNAMAVDQHVEKPEVEKFADESAAKESGSQGRAEGVQMKRLVRKQESRGIRNHKRNLIDDEDLAYAQEIIDLVNKMSDQSSSSLEELEAMEGSNEEDDGDDQEIIDLVDQMSDQNSSSPDELDGEEGSDEEAGGSNVTLKRWATGEVK